MNIYYDPKLKQWYHHELGKTYNLGANHEKALYRKRAVTQDFKFTVQLKEDVLGPIIGILTTKSSLSKAYTGNISLFKAIQKKLQTEKLGIAIVFSPEDINDHFISGIVYHYTGNKWLNVHVPIPNVVYNRIPNRNDEDDKTFSKLKAFFKKRNVPLFNSEFFSKWKVYKALSNDEIMVRYLPETRLLSNKHDLEVMLNKFSRLYIKQDNGHQGDGISVIQKNQQDELEYTDFQTSITFSSLQEFWLHFQYDSSSSPYIVQEAVSPDLIDGKRYDLRIFVHLQNHEYIISGIGVRQSGEQQITTHVHHGGRILPFETITGRYNHSELELLIQECGHQLAKEYGLIGEFSIDLGLSKNGKLYIYEINSKPMKFDELQIKENGLKNLVSLFTQLSGFQ